MSVMTAGNVFGFRTGILLDSGFMYLFEQGRIRSSWYIKRTAEANVNGFYEQQTV
jgi:hypothetical protein